MDIYLDLNKKGIENSLDAAHKRAVDRDGDEGEDNALYENAELRLEDDVGFNPDTETIDFCGRIFFEGKDLGYMSASMPLDFEDIIAIIEVYRKKLGKLKTVLEATKD